MIEKAVEFIKNCHEKTAVIYDIDGDGIGSAVIIVKTIERLFGYIPKLFVIAHGLFVSERGIFREIDNEKIKNIIIVDISVDEEPKHIIELAKKSKILIIDHHQIRNDLNKFSNIIQINPFFLDTKIEPFKYSTSKLTYDICSRITNVEDLDWLAGLGIINDYCGDQWKDFLDSIYRKYPSLKKGSEPYSFDSNFGLIDHMITSGYYHSGIRGVKIAYEACFEASSPLDLLESRTSKAKLLMSFHNEVQEEIDRIIENWKSYAEIYEDVKLVFLELKTKFAIKSPTSTILSIKNPTYTFIIFRREGDFIHVSLRRNDGEGDCGRLAAIATKGLNNAKGGGHKPAAGALIEAKDLEKFKENIKKKFKL